MPGKAPPLQVEFASWEPQSCDTSSFSTIGRLFREKVTPQSFEKFNDCGVIAAPEQSR